MFAGKEHWPKGSGDGSELVRRIINLHATARILIALLFTTLALSFSYFIFVDWNEVKGRWEGRVDSYNEYLIGKKIDEAMNFKMEKSPINVVPSGYPLSKSDAEPYKNIFSNYDQKSKNIYDKILDEQEDKDLSEVRQLLKLPSGPTPNQLKESKRISEWTGLDEGIIIKDILKYEAHILAKNSNMGTQPCSSYSAHDYSCHQPPPPFGEYVWDEYISEALKIWLFCTSAIFGVWSLIGRVSREKNKGWLRLSLVASVIGATLITAYSALFLSDFVNPIAVFAIALPIIMAMTLYGADIHFWVRNGFTESEPRRYMEMDITPKREPQATAAKAATEAVSKAYSETANFWPRFYARCIDTSIIWATGNVLAALIPSISFEGIGIWAHLADAVAMAAILCALIIAYDTVLIARTGQTWGKKLLGLQVVTWTGGQVARDKSFKRARDYLSLGAAYMIFFPFLQVFYAATNRSKILQGKQTSWDEYNQTRVMQKPVSKSRYAFSAVLAWGLILGMFFAISVAKEMQKAEVRQQAIEAFR